MADPVGLTTLVKSLARNLEEQREAVGLLLSLSDVSAARRRIGRIQGCIIVLVAILNGDDPVASGDAATLLNALSSNTQNALHMAEAGYFKPLVQYLKEGNFSSIVFYLFLIFSVSVHCDLDNSLVDFASKNVV